MKNQTDRRSLIIETLRERGPVSIKTLAKEFNISHMTVRRDIDELLAGGRVVRFHGGVRLADAESQTRYDLRKAELEQRAEKEAIAKYAAGLVKPRNTVFIDAGTTTELIAQQLPEDYELTVVSYALNIINIAAKKSGVQVIAAGGVYHDGSGVFEGPEATALLGRTRITTAFLSARAVEFDLGVTCSNLFEVEGKQAAMQSSLSSILVVDSSKLGNVASAHFADLVDFDRMIIDRPQDPKQIATCKQAETTVIFVDVPHEAPSELSSTNSNRSSQ